MAWKRFKKNKTAFCSLIFIAITAFISILGYWITPDSTPMVNEQNVLLATLKPGTKIKVLKITKNQHIQKHTIFYKMLWGQENKYKIIPFSSYNMSADSVKIIEYKTGQPLAFHLLDIAYALNENADIQTKNNKYIFIDNSNNRITIEKNKVLSKVQDNISAKRFILGTDRYGRDVLSQLIIGARISLSVGFISVFISLLIGILLGALAGYYGGKTDAFISWIINVIWAVPTLLLVIAVTFALGKGFWQIFIAVGLTMWVEVARVVRGQFMSLREKEFVEAAKALGYKPLRIIFKHILPNAMAAVIVISAANFASAILLEAGLSFLGVGVQPPMPSWGGMVKENYPYIILDYGYLAFLPGIAIMLMVLAFMLVGNGLRDALDVKTID